MDICAVIAAVLAAALLIALLKLYSVCRSLREIREDFAEKLAEDTNTQITVSSSDKSVRELAQALNLQLETLRSERLKLSSGDAELKSAITNISHDIRTPLTAISGYLDLLEEEEKSETVSRYIAVIHERTSALKTLTEELFRYSVVSATSGELELERLSLNDALEQGLAASYGAFAQRGIVPVVKLPDTAVYRSLDRTALGRIIGNILNNAAKYSDGDLRVTLEENGLMSFENSAHEMSRLDAGRLFDRFYTVESAHNSTGLGLSIAKLLTEKMGGTISADHADGRLRISVLFPGK